MKPLENIVVLDLGRVVAAPVATQMLADFGATVIKVERPVTGDEVRNYGPPFLKDPQGNDSRESGYFLAYNRNKKSVTIDISKPEGQELIRQLARKADILVENYKVGDLKRYGLDYAALAEVNPGLIYCSVTGYGQDGPYADRPGLDSLFQARSGLMSVTGEADGEPVKVGVVIADMLTGYQAAFAIMAALRHREVNGGRGQHIDLALLDVAFASLSHRVMEHLVGGNVPQRMGNESVGTAPAGLYRCADGPLIITAGIETQFQKLVEVLGRPDLANDPRFSVRKQRIANKDELNAILNAELGKRRRDETIAALEAAGVMVAPINTVPEALEDPQLRHRGMVIETNHPFQDSLKLLANPIRMSDTPVTNYDAPPLLGQHTDEILEEFLGVSAEQVSGFRDRGVI